MKPEESVSTAWRRPLAVGLVAAALAVAGISVALHLMHAAALPRTPLTTLAGTPTDLATLSAGKPTVVNLWATWCPPCRRELPVLAAAQQGQSGVSFVFVDEGEDALTIGRYLDSVKLDLANVVVDSGNKLSQEIGATALPITLFYDAGGRMVDTHVGAVSPASLSEKLARLQAPAGRAAKP
jgi:thiol-disulfide isomerase/thioredoxin